MTSRSEQHGIEPRELSSSSAKAIVRSLVRGTTIAEGVRFIHVGHEKWTAAQRELLLEIADDGHSDTKFVRGAYGAGKSHFLSVIQDIARNLGWVTSHVECKVDGVQIDRFETLYPQIVSKIALPEGTEATADPAAASTNRLRLLLERWAHGQLKKLGIRDGVVSRPFDADARLYIHLEATLLRTNLSPDFIRAGCAFSRAQIARDFDTMRTVSDWCGGLSEKAHIPRRYLERPVMGKDSPGYVTLRPIGKGTAVDAMRGLLWLIRSAGFTGLVLCIDEIEELAKLGSRKRQDQALQALREYVDHAGGDGGFQNLCMYLAATPEMFEGEDYFPRYDALATRIQSVGPEINWRGPIIDLDRTPLDKRQLEQMAVRICKIHEAAYGTRGEDGLSRKNAETIADTVSEARFRIAKPRLLARVVVDLLERRRQGEDGGGPPDVPGMISRVASKIAKEIAV
jgi:hypothetical protein